MQTHRQHLRGLTAQLDAFTGLAGMLVVDTELNHIRLFNGATVGGFKLLSAGTDPAYVQKTQSVLTGSGLAGGGTLAGDLTLSVDATVARTDITISSGDGLVGGGEIGGGLVLALGTPGTLGSAGNGVTADSHTHAIDATIARSNIVLTAGDGLTGGGDLSASRTFDLGTPGSSTATSTNAVTVDSHTHAIDATIARAAIALTAGNGLTGGGDLSGNRDFAIGTPGSSTATSTNAVTTDSHTHAIDATIARSAISLTAGSGLTGGGNLTANRDFAIGTPGSTTASSTNAVTADSHTHALDWASIAGQLGGSYALGCIIMAEPTATGVTYNIGSTISGVGSLRATDINGANGATIPGTAGVTWTCMGYSTAGSGTLWIRTA